MKQLTTWAYIDNKNRLCLDIPQLLAAMNVEDTPSNRDWATDEACRVVRELFPDLPQYVSTMDYGTKRIYPGNPQS